MASISEDKRMWLKQLAKPLAEPKPKPTPKQKVKICKKHKMKNYGISCYKCMAEDKHFSPRIIDMVKDANIFNKHTGAWAIGFDPGVLFGIHNEWAETFSLSAGTLKKIAAAMEKR